MFDSSEAAYKNTYFANLLCLTGRNDKEDSGVQRLFRRCQPARHQEITSVCRKTEDQLGQTAFVLPAFRAMSLALKAG